MLCSQVASDLGCEGIMFPACSAFIPSDSEGKSDGLCRVGRAADLPQVFSLIQQVFIEHLLRARTGITVLTGTDMFPQSLLPGGRLMIKKKK